MTYQRNREWLREYRLWWERRWIAMGTLKTLENMSEEEIKSLEEQYGCPVIRPDKTRSGAGIDEEANDGASGELHLSKPPKVTLR